MLVNVLIYSPRPYGSILWARINIEVCQMYVYKSLLCIVLMLKYEDQNLTSKNKYVSTRQIRSNDQNQ